MARTINEIYSDITTQLTTEFASAGVVIDPTKWSKRNLLRLTCYVVATAMALWEQLADVSIAEMSAIRDSTASATKKWLQYKMFQFQYSATDPQNLTIVNNVPAYPTTNTALQIIKGCSVNTTSNNNVIIKVAKGNPLEELGTSEVSAAQGYINQIGTAGIVYQVVSYPPDKMAINAIIYYNGTYSAVIEQSVFDAINNFLTTLAKEKFDGYLYALDIERTIRGVEGVNDVVIIDLFTWAYNQSPAFAVNLILGNDLLVRRYQSYAGYIVLEPLPTTNLTFSPE
jgi:hypothetical protein